jgi:hypothetical protein
MEEDEIRHRARIFRARAERFAEYASKGIFPDTREMYRRLAARESALADQLERQASAIELRRASAKKNEGEP